MNFETHRSGTNSSQRRESNNTGENKLALILGGTPIPGESSSTFNEFIRKNTLENPQHKIISVEIGGEWRRVGCEVTLAFNDKKGKILEYIIEHHMVGNGENPPMIHAVVKADSIDYKVSLDQLVFPASE